MITIPIFERAQKNLVNSFFGLAVFKDFSRSVGKVGVFGLEGLQ